jgi:hypothetical protein
MRATVEREALDHCELLSASLGLRFELYNQRRHQLAGQLGTLGSPFQPDSTV